MIRPTIRARFVRLVVESLQTESGGRALVELRESLPSRLSRMLGDLLHEVKTDTTLPIEDGEALLLAIDRALGDGSGRALERAGQLIASRILRTETDLFAGRNAAAVVGLLRGPLLHPFVDLATEFDLKTTDSSLELTVSVPTRPFTSRVLRHISVGFVRAAFQRSAQVHRITSETIAERSVIRVEFGDATPVSPRIQELERRALEAKPKRTKSVGGLAAEVDRILGGPDSIARAGLTSSSMGDATRTASPVERKATQIGLGMAQPSIGRKPSQTGMTAVHTPVPDSESTPVSYRDRSSMPHRGPQSTIPDPDGVEFRASIDQGRNTPTATRNTPTAAAKKDSGLRPSTAPPAQSGVATEGSNPPTRRFKRVLGIDVPDRDDDK